MAFKMKGNPMQRNFALNPITKKTDNEINSKYMQEFRTQNFNDTNTAIEKAGGKAKTREEYDKMTNYGKPKKEYSREEIQTMYDEQQSKKKSPAKKEPTTFVDKVKKVYRAVKGEAKAAGKGFVAMAKRATQEPSSDDTRFPAFPGARSAKAGRRAADAERKRQIRARKKRQENKNK